ncbi:MAG: isopentenyl phosphate kinase family protein [Candidatus Bathyarchaeota archaeon]|nr:MAG: isopentenyl phosphate kinase family protein [Candidatus Bathyarchaeota archaeon]
MLVVKLGGSVVTVKDQPMTAHHENIEQLAEEIKAAWPSPIVIVHGGGSFGHPVAEKFGLADGFTSERQVIGFSRTHQAMVALNTIIVDTLHDKGAPALSVSPSSFITTDDGRISKADFEIVGRLVVRGFLPILYGDAVLDRTKGFSILSGDQLAVHLATSLGASKLIFGVDVDGVHTSNPKLVPQAKLIQHLSLEKLKGFVKIGSALTSDVTGGMLGKVSEAKAAVEAGVEVQIVNATKPGVILKALIGEPVAGTILAR